MLGRLGRSKALSEVLWGQGRKTSLLLFRSDSSSRLALQTVLQLQPPGAGSCQSDAQTMLKSTHLSPLLGCTNAPMELESQMKKDGQEDGAGPESGRGILRVP